MRKTATAILFFIAFASALAQGRLTLKECLDYGIQNNYNIQIEQGLSEISRNNNTLGNAGMLPSVDANAGYNGSHLKTYTNDGSYTDDNSALNASIGAEWTVFDGFKMQARKSKLSELEAKCDLNLRLAIEDLISNILVAYTNLIYQTQKLGYVKASVDISRERVRIVEARYQVGTMSHLDLKQAMVDLNSDMSKYATQKDVVTTSFIALNRLIVNEPVSQETTTADTAITLMPIASLNELQQATYSSSAEILAAANERKLTEQELRITKADYYPYLKLGASYGATKNLTDSNIKGQTGPRYNITLGMNLFNGLKTKRETNNREIEIQNAKLREKNIKLELDAMLSALYQSYICNDELRKMEMENLVVAQEYYETAIDKYKLGSLSGIELREAQLSLLEAEERMIQSIYNVKICEISLKKISGSIKDYLEN